jgi:hypothetical protein
MSGPTAETQSDRYERALDQLGRPFRRFLLAVVAVLIAVSVGGLLIFPQTPTFVYWTGIPLLVIAYSCPELVFGLLRCELAGTPVSWDRLTTLGRAGRALVTVLGTALLMTPVVVVCRLMLR